jgi:predicted ATPase
VSIRKISLHNFRGFKDAEIELKPLTVLLGPNSAGKSSFGHALAAMSHAHRVFSGTPQANLTPDEEEAARWPVDLGNLDDLRTNGADGPVRVGIQTDAGLIELGFGLDDPGSSLLPSYFRHPKGGEAAGTLIVAAPQDNATPTSMTGTVAPTVAYQSNERTHFEVRRLNEQQWRESGTASMVILDGLLLRSITHERGTSALLSGRARNELEFLLQHLTYLRANRQRPLRTYAARRSGRGVPRLGYAGERSAAVLHLRAEEPVRYADLPKAGEEQEVKIVSDTLLPSVRAWLRRLGLAKSLRVDFSKRDPERLEVLVTLPGQREHNIVEIVFGTSQVLPILIAGLLQPQDSLLIVDLPEAHLHPRPQLDLADFFCSLALSGRFSLVETHSEMFFHRLRLRSEMHDALRDRIAVYFIDEPMNGLCCQPRRVGLSLDEQPDWPVGFLEEAWETESQIEGVRRAKARVEK